MNAPAPDAIRFLDVRRRLAFYLRALWDQGRDLRAFEASLKQSRPYITSMGIHLPESWRSATGDTGSALYRAAVAHAAAHLTFSPPAQKRGKLRPMQVAIAGVLEDARVERLACREMPGLQRLWVRFHEAKPQGAATFQDLAVRLARALADPAYVDDNPWVMKARQAFESPDIDLTDPSFVRPLASLLGNDMGQMRLQFNAKTYVVDPVYRDDNSALWVPQPQDDDEGIPLEDEVLMVQPEEGDNEDGQVLEAPGAEEIAGPQPVGAGAAEEVEDGGLGDWLRSVPYPEWDYLVSLSRPAWCTVQETPAEPGDAARIDDITHRHEALLQRIDALIRGSELRKPRRLRRQMDGDHFDLDAVVNAVIDLRSGRTPDPRLHVRVDRHERDLAVLVLLDLSESTNDLVKASGQKVLDLAREATVLLSAAMDRIGDRFAIHGFCSNGRSEVRYLRFKEFSMPFDDAAKARLAGATGQLSTRMGGALRHATRQLQAQASDKKLILLITDGEPHDIDAHDPKYLQFDAKKAVEEASRAGIYTYCMSLDPKADEYVSRVFGQRNYTVMDRIDRLPEKLPGLYLRLTR